MNSYEELLRRLDDFVRKYYANQLLRGILVLLICLIAFILVVSVGEFYLYLPVGIRIGIAVFFTASFLLALSFWVIRPLAGIARIGKVLSFEDAARIIGSHFPEVSDQLLNILQLKEQSDPRASAALIEASVGQKVRSISVVPISRAIDWGRNRRYLPVLIPLLLTGTVLLFAAPDIFRDASERLLRPTTEFVKPAPFDFVLLHPDLHALRNSDYVLEIEMKGASLPASVSVEIAGEQLPMEPLPGNHFRYTFRNCTSDLSFRFYAAGYYSRTYTLRVLQRPLMSGIQLQLDYPAYTGRKPEQKSGLGDMVIPVGTNVRWNIATEHADAASVIWGVQPPVGMQQDKNGHFETSARILADTAYSLELFNAESKVTEHLPYRIQVIPDKAPVIQMQRFSDSVSGTQIVLNGSAGDDYGIARIVFHYRVADANGKEITAKQQLLKGNSGIATSFQHYFDIQTISLASGQHLEYYVEAWDNDAVHGSKSSRTETFTYNALDNHQLDSAINNNSKQINASLSNSSRQNDKMQQQMESLENKLLNKESSEWQQKQAMQEISRLQEQMKLNLDQVKKRLDEQMRQTAQKNLSDDLKEKQEAVKEQLDQLANKELSEQMKKLQEMMERLNRDKNNTQNFQQLQEMQEENKLFSMDMERLQQLMQKLDAQIKMEDLANKMEQLANKQSALRQETAKGQKSAEQLSKQQSELKKELQQAMQQDFKDMKQALESVKDQQRQNVSQEQQQGEQAGEQMQQSEKSLQQNQENQSEQSQSKAAQNLQEMAESLRKKSSGMDAEEIEMNIRAVRQILTNLVRLSFDQEALINSVRTTNTGDAAYLANVRKQNVLHTNSLTIRDSLFSLSKKLFKLSASINKETNELEKNMRLSLSGLEQRNVVQAATRQQYVMTHANNLALMLNEILSNLLQQQNQNQNKGGGSGSCSKPGGSNPKPGAGKQLKDIISKQQGLGKKMNEAGKQPQQGSSGKKPDGKSQGQSQGNAQQNGGSDGDAQQLVQLAQEQSALRRQLSQLNQLLNSQGNSSIAKELRELQEQMDRNESDLVNRNFDAQFYRRQQEILTRMLETEQSLREQEEDTKRSSRNTDEISRPVPPELRQYLEDDRQLREQYRTIPPSLKPYYRSLNDKYFEQIR
ncbi:MAG: hypothetical protein QM743_07225 [Chitinophagaceae bacterium]